MYDGNISIFKIKIEQDFLHRSKTCCYLLWAHIAWSAGVAWLLRKSSLKPEAQLQHFTFLPWQGGYPQKQPQSPFLLILKTFVQNPGRITVNCLFFLNYISNWAMATDKIRGVWIITELWNLHHLAFPEEDWKQVMTLIKFWYLGWSYMRG